MGPSWHDFDKEVLGGRDGSSFSTVYTFPLAHPHSYESLPLPAHFVLASCLSLSLFPLALSVRREEYMRLYDFLVASKGIKLLNEAQIRKAKVERLAQFRYGGEGRGEVYSKEWVGVRQPRWRREGPTDSDLWQLDGHPADVP